MGCHTVSEVEIKQFRASCIYFKTVESGFITFCSASHHLYETMMEPMKNELLILVWVPEKVFLHISVYSESFLDIPGPS